MNAPGNVPALLKPAYSPNAVGRARRPTPAYSPEAMNAAGNVVHAAVGRARRPTPSYSPEAMNAAGNVPALPKLAPHQTPACSPNTLRFSVLPLAISQLIRFHPTPSRFVITTLRPMLIAGKGILFGPQDQAVFHRVVMRVIEVML